MVACEDGELKPRTEQLGTKRHPSRQKHREF